MFASIVSLIEQHLGSAARAVLPVVIHEVGALVEKAEKGEKVEFGQLAAVLEREAGSLGRSLLERIIARITHGLGPVAPGVGAAPGFDPLKPFKGLDPGKIAHDIEQQVEHAATAAVKQAEDTATTAVRQAGSAAVTAVKGVEQDALKVVRGVWHDIETGLFGLLAKAGLAAAVKVARVAEPSALQVTLGPLQLSLVNIPAVVGILADAEHHPPHDRASLRAFVESLVAVQAVSGMSLQGNVALAALVVESDALSVGFSAEWDADGFIQRWDALMDAIGLH